MRTILFSMCMVFLMSTTVLAQKVTLLDPATVTYSPSKILTSSNLEGLYFDVKEEYQNQFMKNPIRFVEENFDLNSMDLQAYKEMTDIDEIVVNFNNSKGHLIATYNNVGELQKTSQRFRDIAIPTHIWKQIYRENPGWNMESNLYVATGKTNRINKEIYKIKFSNGNKSKTVKFRPDNGEEGRVAGF